MRSKNQCSVCPAIHTKSRSWLRSSSTREPSDPPLRVVNKSSFNSVQLQPEVSGHRRAVAGSRPRQKSFFFAHARPTSVFPLHGGARDHFRRAGAADEVYSAEGAERRSQQGPGRKVRSSKRGTCRSPSSIRDASSIFRPASSSAFPKARKSPPPTRVSVVGACNVAWPRVLFSNARPAPPFPRRRFHQRRDAACLTANVAPRRGVFRTQL